MSDHAKAQVVGRLTRNPISFGSDNTRCSVFTVAVNKGTKEKPRTLFLSAIAWTETSDIMSQFNQGDRVALTGELEFHKSPKLDKGEIRLRVETVTSVSDQKEKRPVVKTATESEDGNGPQF